MIPYIITALAGAAAGAWIMGYHMHGAMDRLEATTRRVAYRVGHRNGYNKGYRDRRNGNSYAERPPLHSIEVLLAIDSEIEEELTR